MIFDELPAAQKRRFIHDIKACDECARQYTSLIETLALFDETANAALPESAAYWLAYNERLRRRLNDSNLIQPQTSKQAERASFWRRVLYMRVQISVPALAAAALVVATSIASLLLLRLPATATKLSGDSHAGTRAKSAPAPAASSEPFVEKPLKIIEVPVAQEKIITRVVYLYRRQSSERKSNAARSNNRFELSEPEKLAHATAAELPRAPLAELSLDGFQPTNDVKLTVIKAAEKKQ